MHHDCTTRNPIKFSYLYIRFDSNANKMHCMYPTRKTQKLHSSLDNSRARVVETAPIVKMRIRSEMENQEGGKNNISLMWRRYKLLFFPPLFRDFWWQWCAEHNWRSNNKNNNSGKTPHHNPPQSKPHLYIDKIAFIVECYLLILGFVAWTFFCYWLIGFSPLQPLHFCHFSVTFARITKIFGNFDLNETLSKPDYIPIIRLDSIKSCGRILFLLSFDRNYFGSCVLFTAIRIDGRQCVSGEHR